MADIATAYVNLQVSTRDIAKGVKREFGQIEKDARSTGDNSGKGFVAGFSGPKGLAGLGGVVTKAMGAAVKAAAVGSVALGAAAGAGLVKMIDMAGRAEQALGGIGSVFGNQAAIIEKESKKAADAFGLTTVAYQELATGLGAVLKNKGVQDYTKWTVDLVRLGGDLAATFGGDAKTAVEALSSALRGESDPIEKYGVSLSEAAVKAKLAEMGITGVATEAEKTQARLRIVMEQTADAQGQAAREHDTYTAALERVKAKAADAAVELGDKLRPAAAALLLEFEKQIPKIQEWAERGVEHVADFAAGLTGSGTKEELGEWGVKGEEFRTKLDSIKTWWDENGDTVVQDAADLATGLGDAAKFAKTLTDNLNGEDGTSLGDAMEHDREQTEKLLGKLKAVEDWFNQWSPQGLAHRILNGEPYDPEPPPAGAGGGGSWGGSGSEPSRTSPIATKWRNWQEEARKEAEATGAYTAEGFAVGVDKGLEENKGTTDGGWDRFWRGVKTFFGINSPSTLFAEVGSNVAAGFTQGVGGGLPAAMESFSVWFADLRVRADENLAALRDNVSTRLGEARDWGGQRLTEARESWTTRLGEARDNADVRGGELRDRVNTRLGEARDWGEARLTEARDRWNVKTGEARDWIDTRLAEARDRGNTRLTELREQGLLRLDELKTGASERAGQMVELMGLAWEKLPDRFKQPVRDLISFLNTHLIGGVNKIAGKVGLGDKWLPDIPPVPMADGGVTNRDPQIRNRPILWAEAGPEAYIPLDPNKRGRSLKLWAEVGRQLGAHTLADGRIFPLPAGSYVQTQGVHGVDRGYDYGAPVGTPVMANANATVVRATDLGNRSYGKYVQLSNGSIYAHLSQILAQVGQQVIAGQLIGKVGNTGNSTGPHLHYVPGGGLGSVIAGALAGALDIGKMFADQLGDVGAKAKALLSGSGLWGELLSGIPGKLATGALTVLKEKASQMIDAGLAQLTGGSSAWDGVILQALARVGQPATLLDTVRARMLKESGGNQLAVNNWDSNARAGTPSKGLMQVIAPTFSAYRDPTLSSNIYDPLANMVASMKYALASYGSLSAAYNRPGGYWRGTDHAAPGWAWVGERGPELMRFRGGEKVLSSRDSASVAAGASPDQIAQAIVMALVGARLELGSVNAFSDSVAARIVLAHQRR